MEKQKLAQLITDINSVIKSRSSDLSKKDIETLVTVRENIKATSDRKSISDQLLKLSQLFLKAGLIKVFVELVNKYYNDH